jgi:hypothetical protein
VRLHIAYGDLIVNVDQPYNLKRQIQKQQFVLLNSETDNGYLLQHKQTNKHTHVYKTTLRRILLKNSSEEIFRQSQENYFIFK